MKILFWNLTFLLVSLLFAAENKAFPGIDGIRLGTPKQEALNQAQKSPFFKDCEISIDSNALLIHSKPGTRMQLDSLPLSSIKVMFNKKRSVQALSLIFQAQTVDAVEQAYRFAEKWLGAPKERSSEKIGFALEAEWSSGKYGGTFFASDQAFEAYLLAAFSDFIQEEESRGEKHPK